MHVHEDAEASHAPERSRRRTPAGPEGTPTPVLGAAARTDKDALLRLQRTAGNSAVVGRLTNPVVQREGTDDEAETEDEAAAEGRAMAADDGVKDDGGIASRVRKRRQLESTFSPRLRARLGGDGPGPVRRGRSGAEHSSPYAEPKERGYWDGQRRFAYDKETWDAVLGTLEKHATEEKWRCPECGDFYPRLRDPTSRQNGITIDHKMDFRTYIYANAAPSEDGNIPSDAAKAAYNDPRNLQGMCRECNSRKGGPKGMYA